MNSNANVSPKRNDSYEQEDLKKCVEVLRKGGVVLYPTDTIWGIGCDATNDEAVARIYKIKKRVESKSMLVLVGQPGMLNGYVKQVPDIAWDLIDYAEKPLTIIYPSAKNLPSALLPEDGSIGIRVTREPFSKRLCEMLGRPIVSTSANISGEPSPSNFSEISDEIKNQMDYIVCYRQKDTQKAIPSSIMKLGVNGEIEILRR